MSPSPAAERYGEVGSRVVRDAQRLVDKLGDDERALRTLLSLVALVDYGARADGKRLVREEIAARARNGKLEGQITLLVAIGRAIEKRQDGAHGCGHKPVRSLDYAEQIRADVLKELAALESGEQPSAHVIKRLLPDVLDKIETEGGRRKDAFC
jgi:hypothetical protein